MYDSPSGLVRPLPPNPPGGDDFGGPNGADRQFDGPPMLPPVGSFHDGGLTPQTTRSGPSSRAATPPQSPGLPNSGGKPRNPLTDLIDSEEQFVALMSAIIRVGF